LPEEPKRRPDLQRYQITGVVANTTPNGAHSIRLGLQSLDEGFPSRHDIWVPSEFVENPRVNAKTLSLGEKVTDPATGQQKVKGNKQAQYARAIGNSDGTAELQLLILWSQRQRPELNLTAPPAGYDDLVAWLNDALMGVELLAARRENDNGFMEIRGLYGMERLADSKFVASQIKKGVRIPAVEQ
jgi:hypothetical protein